MTDSEIAALASAFKNVVAEQGIELRAQIADLRAELQAEKLLSAERRKADAASRERMLALMAEAVVDAVKPRFAELRERTVALEQRAIVTPS